VESGQVSGGERLCSLHEDEDEELKNTIKYFFDRTLNPQKSPPKK
jgi:hypothetical protein